MDGSSAPAGRSRGRLARWSGRDGPCVGVDTSGVAGGPLGHRRSLGGHRDSSPSCSHAGDHVDKEVATRFGLEHGRMVGPEISAPGRPPAQHAAVVSPGQHAGDLVVARAPRARRSDSASAERSRLPHMRRRPARPRPPRRPRLNSARRASRSCRACRTLTARPGRTRERSYRRVVLGEAHGRVGWRLWSGSRSGAGPSMSSRSGRSLRVVPSWGRTVRSCRGCGCARPAVGTITPRPRTGGHKGGGRPDVARAPVERDSLDSDACPRAGRWCSAGWSGPAHPAAETACGAHDQPAQRRVPFWRAR